MVEFVKVRVYGVVVATLDFGGTWWFTVRLNLIFGVGLRDKVLR